jgi:hypothetical protein
MKMEVRINLERRKVAIDWHSVNIEAIERDKIEGI